MAKKSAGMNIIDVSTDVSIVTTKYGLYVCLHDGLSKDDWVLYAKIASMLVHNELTDIFSAEFWEAARLDSKDLEILVYSGRPVKVGSYYKILHVKGIDTNKGARAFSSWYTPVSPLVTMNWECRKAFDGPVDILPVPATMSVEEMVRIVTNKEDCEGVDVSLKFYVRKDKWNEDLDQCVQDLSILSSYSYSEERVIDGKPHPVVTVYAGFTLTQDSIYWLSYTTKGMYATVNRVSFHGKTGEPWDVYEEEEWCIKTPLPKGTKPWKDRVIDTIRRELKPFFDVLR